MEHSGVSNNLVLADLTQHSGCPRPVDLAGHGQAFRLTGVQIRNMWRKAGQVANKTSGKFHVYDAQNSCKLPHENHFTYSLGSKMNGCCGPAIFMGVYALAATLVIIVLSRPWSYLSFC